VRNERRCAVLGATGFVVHLVHSLREPDFAGRDRVIAERVVAAAAAAGVRQIVYLGGPRPAATSAPQGRAHVGEHVRYTHAAPGRVWEVITHLGGEDGRFPPGLAWALRGLLDHALGGVGRYRGRPPRPGPGDVLDFWTVRHRDDTRRELVLGAEMRLPGDAEPTPGPASLPLSSPSPHFTLHRSTRTPVHPGSTHFRTISPSFPTLDNRGRPGHDCRRTPHSPILENGLRFRENKLCYR